MKAEGTEMVEIKSYEIPIRASEGAVFSALVDAIQQLKRTKPGVHFRGVKISVNPSVFGVDEAFSIRIKNNAGKGEIGRIIIKPVDDDNNLLVIPENGTGGSKPPALDPDGRRNMLSPIRHHHHHMGRRQMQYLLASCT